LGTKYLVVLCAGSTLPLAKQSLDEAPYKLSGAVTKLAGITFGRLSPSYSIDNLGFITERKNCCYIYHTLLLGFPNWPVINSAPSSFSGTVAGEGSFRKHILYFVLSFALLYFYLHRFIKNQQKLESLIVVIYLLLVHYVVP
jgi:hypothetical protein